MPAETFLARINARSGLAGLIIFFFALPLLSGVLGRVVRGRPVYNAIEFETLLCAGQRHAEGLSRYPPAEQFVCDGLATTAPYVYIPWLGDSLHGLRGQIGLETLHLIYAIIYFGALALGFWLVFGSRLPSASRLERAPFLGLQTGSMIVWGNIAGVAYGTLAAAALGAARFPALFLAVVVILGSIKQVWLLALAVFLFLDWPRFRRWIWFVGGAILGLLPTAHFLLTGGEEARAWVDVLSYFAFVDRPGQGFLGWMGMAGLPTSGVITWSIWAGYAAAMMIAGIGLAEERGPAQAERVWLALAVASLLNPRLVAYEFLLLAPGVVIAMRSLIARGQAWSQWVLYGALALALLMNVGDLGDFAMLPATLASAFLILAAGLPRAHAALAALLPIRRTVRAT